MRRDGSLLVLLMCSLSMACNSTSSTTDADGGPPADAAPASDAAIGNDAAADGATPDVCPDAGPDLGLATARSPVGTQLHVGDNLSIRGVTSDGYVVYSDDAALTLHAVPLTGGAVVDLGALGPKFWVVVSGSVTFVWSNVNGANVGALSTWSVATGLHSVSTASLGLDSSVSTGDDRILYIDHADATGATGDIYAAAINGSGATKLVSAAILSGCAPELGFVGGYAVASHCDAPFTSSPSTTISSFSLATSTRADLTTNSENYWASAGATEVLVSKNGVGIQVVPVSGGAPTLVDATGFLGVLAAGGNTAIYSTKSGELRRSPVVSPSPATLIPSGFGGFWSLSPDEQWVLYFSAIGSSGGDMYLASAVTAGAPVTLSAPHTGVLRGDAFTANTSHVVYATGFDPCASSATLDALAIGASTPQVLGDHAWMNRALGGSKIVFNDNFLESDGLRFGRADIEWIDLANGAPPTRMVDRADAVIGVSPAGDQLVYVWSARPGPLAGLYVAPMP